MDDMETKHVELDIDGVLTHVGSSPLFLELPTGITDLVLDAIPKLDTDKDTTNEPEQLYNNSQEKMTDQGNRNMSPLTWNMCGFKSIEQQIDKPQKGKMKFIATDRCGALET